MEMWPCLTFSIKLCFKFTYATACSENDDCSDLYLHLYIWGKITWISTTLQYMIWETQKAVQEFSVKKTRAGLWFSMKLLEWKSLFVWVMTKKFFYSKGTQTDIKWSSITPEPRKSGNNIPPLVKLFPGPPPFRSNNVLWFGNSQDQLNGHGRCCRKVMLLQRKEQQMLQKSAYHCGKNALNIIHQSHTRACFWKAKFKFSVE